MMVEKEVSLKIEKEKAQPKEFILKIEKLNYIDDFGKRTIKWKITGFPEALCIPPPWARPEPASFPEKTQWVMTGLPPSFSIPPAYPEFP